MARGWLLLPLSLSAACVLAEGGTGPDSISGTQGSGAGLTGSGAGPGAGGAEATGGGQDGTGGAGAGVPTDWWDAAYRSRVKITFANDSGEQLDGFPVLIRLDSTRIDYARTGANGADLRFVDADQQTALPHEIESWNPGGSSFVWVRVPTLDAGSTEDSIWLYYNHQNPDAEAPDAAGVWEGFAAVYHFAGASLGRDSGPAALDAALVDPVAPGEGKIASALSLTGTGYLRLTESSELSADLGEARTLEVWFRSGNPGVQHIFSQELNCRGYGLQMGVTNNRLRGRFFAGNDCGSPTSRYVGGGNTSYADGGWHHAALVVDRVAEKMQLFIDGAPAQSIAIDTTKTSSSSSAWIGSAYNGNEPFSGLLDELRVSTSARSPGWIAAQHRSMRDQLADYQASEHLP